MTLLEAHVMLTLVPHSGVDGMTVARLYRRTHATGALRRLRARGSVREGARGPVLTPAGRAELRAAAHCNKTLLDVGHRTVSVRRSDTLTTTSPRGYCFPSSQRDDSGCRCTCVGCTIRCHLDRGGS